MLKWIEKARKKPKSVRNHYAFLGAAGATTLIALIWTFSLPSHFAQVNLPDDETTKESVGAFSQFFSDAKQNVASVINAPKVDEEVQDEEIVNDSEIPETSIVIPELTEETINEFQSEQEILNEPQPRTVLISTSSDQSTPE